MKEKRNIANFAFHLGCAAGSMSNPEIVKYLEEKGISDHKIAAARDLIIEISNAFYVESDKN